MSGKIENQEGLGGCSGSHPSDQARSGLGASRFDPGRKVRVRRTPNTLHHYTATISGVGTYGWGNTPQEARDKLAANLAAVPA